MTTSSHQYGARLAFVAAIASSSLACRPVAPEAATPAVPPTSEAEGLPPIQPELPQGWQVPQRKYVPAPPLVSPDDGSVQFRIARDSSRAREDERFFFTEEGVFRTLSGRVERLEEGAQADGVAVESVFSALPVSGSLDARFAVDEDWAVLSEDEEVFIARRPSSAAESDAAESDAAQRNAAESDAAQRNAAESDAAQRDAAAYKRLRFDHEVQAVQLHPLGLLLTERRGRIHLVDPKTGTRKWTRSGACSRPVAVTEASVAWFECRDEGRRELATLVQSDLESGKESHRVELSGPPASRVIQHGDRLTFVADRWDHNSSQSTALVLEEVDLTTHRTRTKELGPKDDSYLGGGYATLEVLVDATGKRRGVVLAVRGLESVLRVFIDGEHEVKVPLPKGVHVDSDTQLVQLGEHLYLADEESLWIFDPAEGEFTGHVTFVEDIKSLTQVDGALVARTYRHFYRLLPGAEQPPSVARVLHSPWQIGEPSRATDGNLETVWEVSGEDASVIFDFDTPVAVSGVAFHGVSGEELAPAAQSVVKLLDVGGRSWQSRSQFSEDEETSKILLDGVRVARHFEVTLGFDCSTERETCRSAIAEISLIR